MLQAVLQDAVHDAASGSIDILLGAPQGQPSRSTFGCGSMAAACLPFQQLRQSQREVVLLTDRSHSIQFEFNDKSIAVIRPLNLVVSIFGCVFRGRK